MSTPAPALRLLVVDAWPIRRRGVVSIVSDAFPTAHVVEAATADEAREALASRDGFHVMIVDCAAADDSALAAALSARPEGSALVLINRRARPHEALRALRGGATACLADSVQPEQLVAALGNAVGGRRYISDSLAEFLVSGTVLREDGAELTRRELAVLVGLASGERATDLATELGVSVKSVSIYRARVLSKLGLTSNADLTRYALGHGLIEPS